MVRVFVERLFAVPVTDEDLGASNTRLHPCLEANDVRWLSSALSGDRMRMICQFAAPDAEAVRVANRSANAGFERVWTAEQFWSDEPGAFGAIKSADPAAE